MAFETFNYICIVSLYINCTAYSFHIFCIKSKKSLCIKTWWFPDFYLAKGLGEFLKEKKESAGNNCNDKNMYMEKP